MACPVLPDEAEVLLLVLKLQMFLPPVLKPLVERLQNGPVLSFSFFFALKTLLLMFM